MKNFELDTFKNDLDTLLGLRDKLTCKQIDYGSCQTSFDRRQMERAENAFYEARDNFIAKYCALEAPLVMDFNKPVLPDTFGR